MLTEILKTSGADRRWFNDDYFDLMVWYGESRTITGFQLCYDIRGNEHAFTWTEGKGTGHYRVDSGETSPLKNMTPVMFPDGVVSYSELIGQFTKRAAEIDPDIYALVLRTIRESRPESSDG